MEITTTIIGAILLGFFFVPMYFVNKKSKKLRTEKQAFFNSLAQQQGLNLSDLENFADKIIGIDKTQKVFLYASGKELKDDFKIIALNSVRTCELNKIARINGHTTVVDYVGINFVLNDNKKSKINLEFYNGEKTLQLNNELQVAEKWVKLINQFI